MWELGSLHRRRTAGPEIKEIGTAAAAARNEADAFKSEGAQSGVEGEASTGGGSVADDWNVILCDTQLINGLCWSNHEYPSTAVAERSNGVRRNRIVCWVPQGNPTSRVVY